MVVWIQNGCKCIGCLMAWLMGATAAAQNQEGGWYCVSPALSIRSLGEDQNSKLKYSFY